MAHITRIDTLGETKLIVLHHICPFSPIFLCPLHSLSPSSPFSSILAPVLLGNLFSGRGKILKVWKYIYPWCRWINNCQLSRWWSMGAIPTKRRHGTNVTTPTLSLARNAGIISETAIIFAKNGLGVLKRCSGDNH